jgi:hypothetical protein
MTWRLDMLRERGRLEIPECRADDAIKVVLGSRQNSLAPRYIGRLFSFRARAALNISDLTNLTYTRSQRAKACQTGVRTGLSENAPVCASGANRFRDKDVEEDTEAVARAIARELNLDYEFSPRKATGSGMRSIKATKKR